MVSSAGIHLNTRSYGRELFRVNRLSHTTVLVVNNGKHVVQLKGILFKTPLTLLKELIVDMGVNRRGDIIEAFNLRKKGSRVDCEGYAVKPSVPYIPMLCGTDEDVVKTMLINPNAYIPD